MTWTSGSGGPGPSDGDDATPEAFAASPSVSEAPSSSRTVTAPSTLDATGCCPCSFLVPTAPTPPRQARQGLYLAKRGFDVRQEGHMGRPQHRVRNNSSELSL